MASLNPPETAPKDRSFLADAGYPWLVMAAWSEAEQCFVTAQIEWNLYYGKDDPSWVTEHERDLLGWLDVPGVDRGQA